MDKRVEMHRADEAGVAVEQRPGSWARHARMLEVVEELRRSQEGRRQLVEEVTRQTPKR